MKRLLLLLAALVLSTSMAYAQVPPSAAAPIQQTWQRLDASTGVCAAAPAINVNVTCTITPPNGMYVYFNFLQVGACGDGVLSKSAIQANWTTTNLSGWVAETAYLTGSTVSTNAFDNLCGFVGGALTAPLKSTQAGVAVTIVPPTANADVSYPIIAEYYFAP